MAMGFNALTRLALGDTATPETLPPIPPGADGISGYFTPSKICYLVGEPIEITFRMENHGTEAFTFKKGGAYRFAEGRDDNFHVQIIGPEGYDHLIYWGGHGGFMDQHTIEAGDVYESTLLLNAWADLLEAGRYTINLRRPIDGDIEASLATLRVSPHKALRPSRLPQNESRLKGLYVEDILEHCGECSREEAFTRAEWHMRMPMIESTFEIEVLPFDAEKLVEIVEALPLGKAGIVLEDGDCSSPIGILSLQLGLSPSKAKTLEALRLGVHPRPRERQNKDDHWSWVALTKFRYEQFGHNGERFIAPELRQIADEYLINRRKLR